MNGGLYNPPKQDTYVVKLADEIRNNDDTVADDAELFFAVEANSCYKISLCLWAETPTGIPDMHVELAGPVGMFCEALGLRRDGAGDASFLDDFAFVCGSSITPRVVAWYNGLITIGAAAGTIHVQWAQQIATVEDTTLRKGSYLTYRKLY